MKKQNALPWIVVVVLLLLLITNSINLDIPFLSWFKSEKTVEKVITQHDSIINRDTIRISEIHIQPRYYRIVKNDTMFDTTFVPTIHNDTFHTLPFIAILDTVFKKDSFYTEFHYPEMSFKKFLSSHKPDTIRIPQIQYNTIEKKIPTWILITSHALTGAAGIYFGAKIIK